MQGHRTSVSPDHGSTSYTRVDSQMNWNEVQASAQNHQSGNLISSNETNIRYLHHVADDGLNNERSLGENSSNVAQSHGDHNESKGEHIWSFHSRAGLTSENRPYEPSGICSLTANGSPLPQISGPDIALPQDLNMRSEFEDSEDDECQVIEHSNTYISIRSPNEQIPSTGNSSNTSEVRSRCGGEENEDRPSCSLDGPRVSCKRKALEVHTDQTSVAGRSNCFQQAERSQWHTSAAQIVSGNTDVSSRTENEQVTNNGSEQTIPRLRLGGGAVSVSPFSLHAREPAENSGRSFHLRINGSHQQDRIPENSVSTEADVSSSRHSSRQAIQNQLPDLNPATFVESGNLQGGSVLLHVPSVRRNTQSRWVEASSSRTTGSSTSSISEEADDMLCEELATRNIPRNISEHLRFVPASEVRSSSQEPTNWNLPGGSDNAASNSRAGSTSGANSSAPTWSHRSCPQYSRRLSEIVRRSLLSSPSAESGGQNSNHATQSTPPATISQEMGCLPGSGDLVHTISNSGTTLGVPYTLRSLAAAREGRSSAMSEQIRHVLDLMQRGEGLRFEDVMVLDHSVFFGMADVADRHRDMRLDVDNMSYEELLALGERIGNVCIGLNEETITTHLKQNKYVANEDQPETEPCSICREEYIDGEHLGSLECGHDFHHDCIKQWLMQKNLCPVCKTTGLNTMKPGLESSQQ